MFFKDLKEARGNVLAEVGLQRQRSLAVKYTHEGEGHANEGMQIEKDVVSKICTDFDDIHFETVVKSERPTATMNRVLPKDQAGAWQLISVNDNRQSSADISVIVDKLLIHVCARTSACHLLPTIDEILGCAKSGFVCYGSKIVLATFVFSDQFFNIRRSWRSEDMYSRSFRSCFCY